MTTYKTIAKRFSWGGNFDFLDFHGRAVVSEDAFFLIIHGDVPLSGHLAVSAGLAGGPIGFFFGLAAQAIIEGAVAMSQGLAAQIQPRFFDLRELPSSIVGDPTWPEKKGTGKVVVIPRAAVERLHYAWHGTLKIYTEDFVFCLEPHFFLRPWIKGALRERGWKC